LFGFGFFYRIFITYLFVCSTSDITFKQRGDNGTLRLKRKVISNSSYYSSHSLFNFLSISDIFFHFVINQREIGRLGQVAYWRGGYIGSMGSPKVMEVGRSGQGGNRFGMSAGVGEEFAEGK